MTELGATVERRENEFDRAAHREGQKRQLGEIALMTMNINGQDGWYQDEPLWQWKTRAPLVRAVVDSERPDVVCFQEFGVTSYDDAFADPPSTLAFYNGEQAGDILINPIAWSMERFRSHGKETFWLSPDGTYGPAWEGAERGCSMVELEDLETGRELMVYNVHLDNKSRLARREGTKKVLSHVALRATGLPVVIAGDFNATTWRLPEMIEDYDDTPFGVLEEEGFTGAATAVDSSNLLTFHGYKGEMAWVEPDYYIVDPDHIYVRGMAVKSVEVVKAHEGDLFPSDHYPVKAIVTLP